MRTPLLLALCVAPLFAGVSGDASLVELAKADNHQAAITLIDQHVNVNTPTSDGTTALHWAAHNGDAELVDRLLRAGADAKAKNQFGATPMSEAAFLGNVAIIEKLLKAGADPDSPNADGQTALMLVARTDNVAAAKLLLRARRARGRAREAERADRADVGVRRKPARHGARTDRARRRRERALAHRRITGASQLRAARPASLLRRIDAAAVRHARRLLRLRPELWWSAARN